MDVLLDRLDELAGGGGDGGADADRLAEAHMLWRTLEVLVASFNPRELRADDPSFAKLLACARRTVDNEDYWAFPPGHGEPAQLPGDDRASVYLFAVRVVAKLASRGEDEREVMVRDGVASSIVRSLHSQTMKQRQDAPAVAAALDALVPLASSAKHRSGLADVVPLSLEMMTLYPLEAGVQLASCKLLQQLLQEPGGKERIPRAQGVSAVVNALRSFPDDVAIATVGLAVLAVLCTHSEWSSSGVDGVGDQMQDAAITVVVILSAQRHAVQVVEAGAKLLSSLVLVQPSAKQALALSKIWEIATVAIEAPSTDAARGLADVLTDVIADERCKELLMQGPHSADRAVLKTKFSSSSVEPRDVRVESLVKAILSLSDKSDSDTITSALLPPPDNDDWPTYNTSKLCAQADNEDDQYPIADDLRYLREAPTIDIESSSPLPSPLSPEGLGDYEQFMSEVEAVARTASASSYGAAYPTESPSSSRTPTPRSSPETSIPLPIPSSPFPSMRCIDDKLLSTESLKRRIISDASTSTQWQDRCESVTRDFEKLSASHSVLKDSFHILERRAMEQTNMLSIQSSRIQHQSHIHQQVLDRMCSLESELLSMKKQYQVEHELRLAEATQSERMSLTLHDATQEIKVLSLQRNSASRELQEREKLRVDYQSRATETKQLKQRLETERDEATLAFQLIKQENAELHRQLQECRQEGREALTMREEDVDARKPRVFSEVILRPGSAYVPSTRRGVLAASPRSSLNNSSYLKTKRADDRLAADMPTSSMPDTLEVLARDDWAGPSDPKHIDRSEIERCLQSVYELLGVSADGDGVHIATVRRFFFESGLAQPPAVVAADVDGILAKVLAQSNENLKKTLVRKDYTVGQTMPAPSRVDARRYRYFDQAAFNEAVTIVGMKRFPRLELLRVLQNVVSLYLLPYRRQFRSRSVCSSKTAATPSNNASGSSLSRSMSMSLSPTNGAVLTSGCASVVRAILSGLALHIGRGNDHQLLAFDGDTSEIRYHSSNNNSNSSGGGTAAKRKREDVVYSMLEMHGVLSREHKPLVAIFEFYGSLHYASALKDELFGLGFELVLNFAMDFEVIPSFMDRVSLKHLYSEVAGYVKTYFALQKKVPFAADAETLKKAAFLLVLARVAIELFGAKVEFETPERQISALLQWIDNSVGRDKILRKASLPVVIKFSRRLYTPNA